MSTATAVATVAAVAVASPPCLTSRELERLGRMGVAPPQLVRETRDAAGVTQKFLFRLDDGVLVETVLMLYPKRATVCLSAQAGCAMGCVFCATGRMGLRRNLSAAEIAGQALFAQQTLAREGVRLRNAVFMGMGEPLDNYDAVMGAADILRDPGSFALRAGRITLSTVGVVPQIRRLTDEARPVRLAVSLHAASQKERAALIPAARKWPLDTLIEACRYHAEKMRRRIFFEWTLIRGKNDTPEHAQCLADLLAGLASHVNLIPLNPVAAYAGGLGTEAEKAREFQAVLLARGIPATLRQYRGADISAACGQLCAENTTG
ncbi:MAG: 23S rRNA (adenine(2503)-C(2))-methyltransferase RlmN [Puniceicoccales bacterium]|jgi:23S rRNA (adenine2503-C2)-methyltransferase|nr:23S rRNA (adenine(2503)-C(2))-methyltransferase RlmN [Puniceicoccales bacterium]